jgi:hypothetical protein
MFRAFIIHKHRPRRVDALLLTGFSPLDGTRIQSNNIMSPSFGTSTILFASFLILAFPHRLTSQTERDTFRDTVVVGRDVITVFMNSIPFQARSHRIDSSKTEFGVATFGDDSLYLMGRIDGRPIFGTDGDLPRSEIGRLEVRWNKMLISIPESLYADCFDPSFNQDPRMIELVASEDGSHVLLEMHGSDGAGAYTVWWIISRNGKHSRFITREC